MANTLKYYILTICLGLSFSVLSQKTNKIHSDTVYIKVQDTILVNWIVEPKAGLMIKKESWQNITGGIDVSYLRNNIWYKLGFDYYRSKKEVPVPMKSLRIGLDSVKKTGTEIWYKVYGNDSVTFTHEFTYYEIISTQIVEDTLVFEQKYYDHIMIPLSIGGIYDSKKTSVLYGAGVAIDFTQPARLNNESMALKDKISILATMNTSLLYYIAQSTAIGIELNAYYTIGEYNAADALYLSSALKLSFFL